MANQYPYQGQDQGSQQFRDLFGQSRDEGTIEEHIHRTAVKRMDHARMPHVLDRPGLPGKVGVIFGTLGIAVAVAALALLMVYKGSASAQMGRMQDQITAQGQQLQALQAKQQTDARNLTGKYSGLSGKIGALDNAAGAFPLVCGGVGADFYPLLKHPAVKNLIAFVLAMVVVGYCFYAWNGQQMFPDPHPDPPPAAAVVHHHPATTVKDVNGRLWKCAVKKGTYGCVPMPGRVG